MPTNTLHIGPFAGVYVGLASGTSSDILTQVTVQSTGAHKVATTQPESFSFWDGNSLQSGPVGINVQLVFLSDNPDVLALSNGNFFGDGPGSPSSYDRYMLLLVHPDDTAQSSILIPTCYTLKSNTVEYSKTAPTTVPLTFVFQKINRFDDLYFQDTADALATILGARSPI